MVTRRRLLALLGAASVPFAGCSDRERRTPGTEDPPGGFGTPSDDAATRVSASETETATPTETPVETTPGDETATNGTAADGTTTATATPEGLDLREANVVAVDWRVMNGVHRFDVTLYHDDDGEEGHADWWQVETTDGRVLARRDLLHSHGTREFTRSESVRLPDGVTCVVVRGHDRTHGFGGRAMVANLETGETTPVRQGSNLDPAVADGIC